MTATGWSDGRLTKRVLQCLAEFLDHHFCRLLSHVGYVSRSPLPAVSVTNSKFYSYNTHLTTTPPHRAAKVRYETGGGH